MQNLESALTCAEIGINTVISRLKSGNADGALEVAKLVKRDLGTIAEFVIPNQLKPVEQLTHFECMSELQDRWISEHTINSVEFDAIYGRKSLEDIRTELQSYRDDFTYVVKSGPWHAPGLGEVHNEAHDGIIFCTNGDDVVCDALAKKVCNALNAPNAASRAAIAEATEIIQRRSESLDAFPFDRLDALDELAAAPSAGSAMGRHLFVLRSAIENLLGAPKEVVDQQPLGYVLAYPNGKPIWYFGGANFRPTLEEAKEASLLHLGSGEPIAVFAGPQKERK